jgi:myo-inositol-1(or 4)-monophosphatase
MLALAIDAARAAGAVLAAHYGQPHQIKVKGPRDITTEADLEAQATAIELIRARCPKAHFVAEEDSAALAGDAPDGEIPAWYIDPLDGTTNFAHGYPGFSVSVAMAQHGRLQCGAVYDPLLDNMFSAAHGQGAYLNGRRLAVSDCRELGDAVGLLDWPRDPEARRRSADFLATLSSRIDTVRSSGSAALSICYVAAGWADLYYQYTLLPWDVAAGILLVEEAGGRVTDVSGRPYRLQQPDWLVTNGHLHEAVLALEPQRY